MPKLSRKFYVFLLSAMALFAILLNWLQVRKMKDESSNFRNSSYRGTSLLHRYFEESPESTIKVLKSNLLENKQSIRFIDYLVMVDPISSISKQEAVFIKEWVKQGGEIILSAQADYLHRNLSVLGLHELESSIKKDKQFKNRTLDYVQIEEPKSFFKKDHVYAFYSNKIFHDLKCAQNRLFCFYRKHSLGEGAIHVFIGLSPLSNILLSRSSNRGILYSLEDKKASIFLDEYHHFFTEKSAFDLFTEPVFIFPLLGMLACVFLFFFKSKPISFEIFNQKRGNVKKVEFSEFSRSLISSLSGKKLANGELLNFQLTHLKRLFPDEKDFLEKYRVSFLEKDLKLDEINQKVKFLLDFHRKQIMKRQGNK